MTADELAALSERTARILAGGGGLKAIANALAEVTHGAVLIEDEQWRHLALAESKEDLGPLPPSFSPFYRGAAAGSANGVVRASISNVLQGLCAPMTAQREGESGPGFVTLFLHGKSRSDVIPALRIAAGAASVELARRGAGRSQARRDFWEQFLRGDFADVAGLKNQAAALSITLPNSFVAAVFEVEGAPQAQCRDLVQQSLQPADAICPLPGAGTQVVALFPIRHKIDIARSRQAAHNAVRDVQSGGTASSVHCGLGAAYPDLLGVPASIREARLALTLGRRLWGRGTVTVYSDLGVYALLHTGGERDAFTAFAESLIEPLIAYDRKHKTDLLATLQLYFDVGENVKEAAERLSVHRHTIFYRLNQIAQILKTDLKTPRGQLSLRAALAIRQMNAREELHD